MSRAYNLVSVLLSWMLVSCSASPPSVARVDSGSKTRTDDESPKPLSLARPLSPKLLTFPPAPKEARRVREALPVSGQSTQERVTVVDPPYDNFEVDGNTLRFRFSHAIAGATPGRSAGEHLSLSPSTPGRARWRDPHTLEFVPTAAFDPQRRYQVEITNLEATSGARLETAYAANFTVYGPSVAGKSLGYLPKPGDARVVALSVADDDQVARRPRLSVLYDQPISAQLARQRTELATLDSTLIPTRVSLGSQFNGRKAAFGQVVLIEALRPLAHGTPLELRAQDQKPGPDRSGLQSSFSVAPKFEFLHASCTYSGQACPAHDGAVLMDNLRVHLVFNNPVAGTSAQLVRRFRVQPPVRGLSVDKYDNYHDNSQLIVRGNFRPSTTYSIQVLGLKDRYGSPVAGPVRVRARQRALPASLSMAEGQRWLDEKQAAAFEFTSRNVERAQLWVWRVGARPEDLSRALGTPTSLTEQAPFTVLPVDIQPQLDQWVERDVDLSRVLAKGQHYVIQLRLADSAFDARAPDYPGDSPANVPPTAFVSAGDGHGLAVHVHHAPDVTFVHVAEEGSGTPVVGARVRSGTGSGRWTMTDARGVAKLDAANDGVVEVQEGGRTRLVKAGEERHTARYLFPEFAQGPDAGHEPVVVQTDRGVYRPGETLHFKVSAFHKHEGTLIAQSSTPLSLTLKGPDGRELMQQSKVTNRFGSVHLDHELDEHARLGTYRLEVRKDHALLDVHTVRVLAFQAPKFVVDVKSADQLTQSDFTAQIGGRYLFGAPLNGADLTWTLKAEPGRVPDGALAQSGLTFAGNEDEPPAEARYWSQSGVGRLDANGKFELHTALPVNGTSLPTRITLEAEVMDQSNRAAATRHQAIFHPSTRYAGLALERSWIGRSERALVKLGVVDHHGNAVTGSKVEAVIEHIVYRQVKERDAHGRVHYAYRRQHTLAGSCTAVSAASPVVCALAPPSWGYYLVTAKVDGRAGGSLPLWVLGDGSGSEAGAPYPNHRLKLVADKAKYRPGDTAHLLVDSPWSKATALVTVESDHLVDYRVVELTSRLSTVDIALRGPPAPYVHATVTVLPKGGDARQAPRVGALRLPLSLDETRLNVAVKSDHREYRPGSKATLTVNVSQQGVPTSDVEVALAVVDEGVLRLTGFHAPDPADKLWTGAPLLFRYADTRSPFAEWLEKSHVAGDGGDESSPEGSFTRSRFVSTAYWKPDLVTDGSGQARVTFQLPDNLTEFRMLAVALDRNGRSGAFEGQFRVNQQISLQPSMPRFAKTGDRFEAAAMLHNTGTAPFHGSLEIGGQRQSVDVAPLGQLRALRKMTATGPGTRKLGFLLSDSQGRTIDSVEHNLQVAFDGARQKPRLFGSFTGEQTIALRVPEQAASDADTKLEIVVGENLHPELGAELEFLLGYPHGCVEQTTSSTLPLLAARSILPLLGITAHDQEFFDTRIRHGLDRLNSMRTEQGGLAYWPGGHEPNVFGTAYAMQAVVHSQKAGIALPAGLRQDMLDYLRAQLFNAEIVPEVRSAIALSLAESGRLVPTDSDALFEAAQSMDVFGKANVALALQRLQGQNDRIRPLLDSIERVMTEGGELAQKNREDLHFFSSDTRALAQASVALQHLRPTSPVLLDAVQQLLGLDEGYTTQATSYRLLALSEHVRARANTKPPVVRLDGAELAPQSKLAGGGTVYTIALSELRGRQRTLSLHADSGARLAFSMNTEYWLPIDTSARASGATSSASGPDLYRVFTTPSGEPVDLEKVEVGQLLRVALLAVQRDDTSEKLRYLAITDELPAGFEPVDTSLETVAHAPELGAEHPFAQWLNATRAAPDHLELGDSKVQIYFDAPGATFAVASYLVRATTRGEFALPRATAELMYEAHSTAFTDSGRVTIR